MGRCRGKGKKLNEVNYEDCGSGEEEKIPVQRKRGRPVKVKQEVVHRDSAEKIEDDERENASSVITTKERTQSDVPKRRRRNSVAKVKAETTKEEETADETKSSTEEESVKQSGFRQSGSRRKNKPYRAAEAVVECN